VKSLTLCLTSILCIAGAASAAEMDRDGSAETGNCVIGDCRGGAPADPNPGVRGPAIDNCINYQDYFHLEGSTGVPGDAYDMAMDGAHACVAIGDDGLQVIDVTDPGQPRLLSRKDTPGFARGVALAGPYAYVADNSALLVIDLMTPRAPRIVGSVDLGGCAGAVAVSGGYAYVVHASCASLDVIDISDPESPQIVSQLSTGAASDVAVSGNYAYLAGDDGLRVLDVTDPLHPTIVGSVAMPAPSSGLAVSESHAYVAVGNFGLQVVDVGNPENPWIAGSVDTALPALNVAVSGSHVYVGEEDAPDAALQIVDVANPLAPRVVDGIAGHDINARGVAISGSVVGFTFENHYVQGSGIWLLDGTNPMPPPLLGRLSMPGGSVTDMAISGDLGYAIARVAGESELQVLDLTDPQNPEILGVSPVMQSSPLMVTEFSPPSRT
jgi:hypothetical protein